MAKPVFYSVSPVGNSTDLKNGSPTITISSGVATLSEAQTGNIGAGCRIEYSSTHCYIAPNRIGFDNGSTEIKPDTKIEGGTSGATGIVRVVHVSSGAWGNNDAAGYIYFETTSGIWQDNETINQVKPTSVSSVATTDGTLEGNLGNGNTEFVVLTATGSTPTDVSTATSVTHIYHEYASLNSAETGMADSNHLTTSDLTSADVIMVFCCYKDHVDADADAFSGQYGINFYGDTTDSTRYFIIFGDWDGNGWDDNYYRIEASDTTGSDSIYCNNNKILWYRIQFEFKADDVHNNGFAHCSNNVFSYCYFKGTYTGTDGSGTINEGGGAHYNCIVTQSGNLGTGYDAGLGANLVDVFNCTIYNCRYGVNTYNQSGTNKNCAVFNNYDDFYSSSNVSYCATDDGDGSNSVTPSDWDNVFEDYANGDFRLKSTDTDLKDAGTDLSSEGIWRDIAGNERGSSWDIGAFEYVAAGGATAAISDTIALTEALTGIVKYKAAAIDSIGFGETVTPLARLLGTISDIVNLADTVDASSAIAGVIQDTLALSDTLGVLAGFKGSLSDTINLAESLTVLAAWKIAINDSLALSDNARTTLIASIVDSLGLADTAAGLTGYKSNIADTINFGDTASSLRSLVAVAIDSLDFVTSVTGTTGGSSGLTAEVSDALGLSDSAVALGNYQVTLADNVNLNDATNALAKYLQSVIDIIGLTDRTEIITAIGKVNVTFILKVPGTTFKLKVPGTTFTLK